MAKLGQFRKREIDEAVNKAILAGLTDVREEGQYTPSVSGICGYHILGKSPDGSPMRFVSPAALLKWVNRDVAPLKIKAEPKPKATEPKPEPIKVEAPVKVKTPDHITVVEAVDIVAPVPAAPPKPIHFRLQRFKDQTLVTGNWTVAQIGVMLLGLPKQYQNLPLMLCVDSSQSNETYISIGEVVAPAILIDALSIPDVVILRNGQ